MNSEGTELIQNLGNTQSNTLPFCVMMLMDSKKKQIKNPKHNTQSSKTSIYNKGRTAVEIKNFMPTTIIYSKDYRRHSPNKLFAKITLISYCTKQVYTDLLTTARK